MRKLLATCSIVMAFSMPANPALANPYDKAVSPTQCREIHKMQLQATVIVTMIVVLVGGNVSNQASRKNLNACLARTSAGTGSQVLHNAILTPQTSRPSKGRQQAVQGQTHTGFGGQYSSSAICPPGFNGMFRGTLYCVDGRLR